MISQEIIEEVKRSADIVEIISDYVPGLRKNGANYKGLSPFTNEKTASFIVSPEKQIFKDFSSGKGGSVFKFLQEYLKISFPEAVETVAEKVGITIPKKGVNKEALSKSESMRRALEDTADFFNKNIHNSDLAFSYLKKRGFSTELVSTFQIGYSPDDWNTTFNYLKNRNYQPEILEEAGIIKKTSRGSFYDYYKGRLIFPIRNKLGRTVGFGGRDLSNSENSPKYLNTPQTPLYDKSKILYGLFEAKDEIRIKNFCILVEGYADVVSLHQADIKNVVASSGTALTSGQLDLLKNYTKTIYLIYDADKAGINATEKGIDLSLRMGFETKIVQLPDGEDPDSVVQSHGKSTFMEYLNKSLDFVSFKKWVFKWKYGNMSISHRSELIRSLISIIKSIPDRFKHSHYISRVESELSLSEIEKKYFYEELLKDNTTHKSPRLEKVELPSHLPDEIDLQPELKIDEIEKHIFIYLIDNFDAFSKICEEQYIQEGSFITEDARYIFNILDSASENESIFDFIENDKGISEKEKNFIFDITLNREEVNKKLVQEKSLHVELNISYLKDSLIKIKKVSLENEYNELLKKISDSDNGNLLKRLKQISENLQSISEELSE